MIGGLLQQIPISQSYSMLHLMKHGSLALKYVYGWGNNRYHFFHNTLIDIARLLSLEIVFQTDAQQLKQQQTGGITDLWVWRNIENAPLADLSLELYQAYNGLNIHPQTPLLSWYGMERDHSLFKKSKILKSGVRKLLTFLILTNESSQMIQRPQLYLPNNGAAPLTEFLHKRRVGYFVCAINYQDHIYCDDVNNADRGKINFNLQNFPFTQTLLFHTINQLMFHR
ncbi:hypothetical protein RF11_04395 [Thelohanellus kitauei]|uniref:Uncharacterized protein n=1 Tax=Thelohanellus kitauei TaxID=669202 RepID=A0A0C2N5E7_THEKT|nr:hypothetical protein RF11_04395 [Thelohanellus kitauei]